MNKYSKTMLLLSTDLFCLCVATVMAYLFRFDFDVLKKVNFSACCSCSRAIPYCLCADVFLHVRCIALFWRYASMLELVRIVQSVAGGFILATAASYFSFGPHYVPLSILPLQAFFYLGLLLASRAFYRMYRASADSVVIAKKVLIVGAGQAGEGVFARYAAAC